MARKSVLSAALPSAQANENAAPEQPAPVAAVAVMPRRSPNAGRYHLGGYFDHDDPTAEAFRILAARTRRKQQDLLAEAIADLVEKYRAREQFGQ